MNSMHLRSWQVCCLWLLAACQDKAAAPQPSAAATEVALTPALADEPGVRWTAVRRAADVRSFEATGRLLAPPQARAEVTLPLSATIIGLRVAAGEQVRAGQLLAEVAIPEAARAQGQLDGARLRASALSARLSQLQELRSEGLARGGELADAQARLAEANASEREASALLDTVASTGIRRHDKHYDVLAPIAGTVVATNAPLGSSRGPQDGPICVISAGAASRVEARFGFDLSTLGGASYELWSQTARVAGLRLVAQAPDVNPGDATRLAWFDLVEPVALPQGSLARVRLHLPDDCWVVPLEALSTGAALSVETSRGQRVPLQLLATLGREALVRGPLAADDLVAQREQPK